MNGVTRNRNDAGLKNERRVWLWHVLAVLAASTLIAR